MRDILWGLLRLQKERKLFCSLSLTLPMNKEMSLTDNFFDDKVLVTRSRADHVKSFKPPSSAEMCYL